MGILSYIIRINYIASINPQDDETYFLYNGHGDVVQTVNETGTVQNHYDYDIWGNPTLTVETTPNAIRYAGEFFDNETGLYYLRARYYDPYSGRFTTEDSYWGEEDNPLSLNRYTYCENDPIQYVDPTGHYVSDWDRDNLSSDAITQLENCGAAYNIAKSNNDKEGMDAAHDAAEKIRDGSGLRGGNVQGTADGNTVIVDSSGNSTVYTSNNNSEQRQQEIRQTLTRETEIVEAYKATNNWSMPLLLNEFMDAMASQPTFTESGNGFFVKDANGFFTENWNDLDSLTNILLCSNTSVNGGLNQPAVISIDGWEISGSCINRVTYADIERIAKAIDQYAVVKNRTLYIRNRKTGLVVKIPTVKSDGFPISVGDIAKAAGVEENLTWWDYNGKHHISIRGTKNTVLFKDTDLDLKPEVQQMISYYDDMSLYANVAYDSNIISADEYSALTNLCEEKVQKLRDSNEFEEPDDYAYQLICGIGSFIPGAGYIFDVLGDTQPVYAADISSEAINKISNPSNMSRILKAASTNLKYNYYKNTVYELVDDAGNVKYVGRTRQEIKVRQKQHWKADPLKNGLRIQVAEFEGKTLTGLSHSEARGLEHLVFESYGGFNNKNLLNKIRPLDLDNPKVAKKATEYIKDAWKFIKKLT